MSRPGSRKRRAPRAASPVKAAPRKTQADAAVTLVPAPASLTDRPKVDFLDPLTCARRNTARRWSKDGTWR